MDLDHRELNGQMGIFATDALAGSGLPLWLPDGAVIRSELEKLAKDLAHEDGCVDVYSPVLGKRALYERSGHLAKFSQDMFPPMKLGDDEVMLRPANCPHHALIYAANQHSYRELPIRLNEMGSMFRAERSGVVSGLSRVRQITLDDTHVFCRSDQVLDEASRALRSALKAQSILGLPVDYVRLSMRDGSNAWLGSDQQWASAQDDLRSAARTVLDAAGPKLVEAPGEAAFYGPKLDLQVRDGRGHEETIATVQLDFNQPERFDLTYEGEDGHRHRVVMIHRGTVGTMERVTASLLERYQGRLPFWLAPVQLVVLPVSTRHDKLADALVDQARSAGLRCRVEHHGSLGSRIRGARNRRDSLIAVIGDKEAQDGTVHITDVATSVRASVPLSDLLELTKQAYENRQTYVSWPLESPQ